MELREANQYFVAWGKGFGGEGGEGVFQCVANIRIFKYIRIIIDKYIHSKKMFIQFQGQEYIQHSFLEFLNSYIAKGRRGG